MQREQETSEQLNEMLDPHRVEERQHAGVEIAGRLFQKGIDVGSTEDPAILDDLLSAVERFENAVANAGGDPMVNSPDSTDPQNPEFVTPSRNADERLDEYATRIEAAAQAIWQK